MSVLSGSSPASSAAPLAGCARCGRGDRGRHRRHVGRQGAAPDRAVGQPARGRGRPRRAGDRRGRGARAADPASDAHGRARCGRSRSRRSWSTTRSRCSPARARRSIPAHGAISVAADRPRPGGDPARLGWIYVRARHAARRARSPARWGWPLSAPMLANRFVLPRLYGWFHATLSVMTVGAVRARGAAAPARGPAARRDGRRARRPPPAARCAGRAAQQPGDALRGARADGAGRAGPARRPRVVAVAADAPPPSATPPEVALPPLPDGPRRPEADVLLITIDALRADHVGAYGYTRPTTPNIDALAAGGTRFTHAYAQAPHTSFSVASMLTGKYFPTLARLAPGERHEPLAAVLRTYGWRTAAFYPPAVFFVDSQKLKAYADTNFDFEYVKFEYIDANKRVNQVFSYYDRCSRGARSSGCTSSSRTSRTRSTRASRSAAATSIATTARSPTPTRRSGG